MPRLPWWVSLVAGLIVAVWGIYRISIGVRMKSGTPAAADPTAPRHGLRAMPRSSHLAMGFVYLLLGTMLTLHAFGLTIRDLTSRF